MHNQAKQIKRMTEEVQSSVSNLKSAGYMPKNDANMVLRICKAILKEEDQDKVQELALQNISDLAINWAMIYDPLYGETLEETLEFLLSN